MNTIYFIGGSPCSGKSTIAERLVEEYKFYYFKLDDFLDKYMQRGKQDGKEFISQACAMSADEQWMRNPKEQNDAEIKIYKEMFEYVLEDLGRIDNSMTIITEGAGFLPELMKEIGISAAKYICITPTREFQYSKFQERPFVPYVLAECNNKKEAFVNWMERDVLFGEHARKNARLFGYKTLIVDGNTGIKENLKIVKNVFHLE